MGTCHAGEKVVCNASCEPEEVYWQNLALDDAYQVRTERWAYACIAAVCLLAAGLIAGLKVVAVNYKEDNSFLELIDGKVERTYTEGTKNLSLAISTAISLVSVLANGLLKMLVIWWTKREGQDTQTEHQRSIFSKLTIAYVVNSTMTPIVLGFIQSGNSSGNAIDEAWYEAEGIVYQVLFIVLINAVAVDAIKIFPPATLLKRYVLSIFVESKSKLARMWVPPTMHIGEMYAHSAKTFAMGVMYGPLFPPAYLITALAMGISYWATRYGIKHWYKKPAAVDVDMLDRLVGILTYIQALGIVMAAIAANAASSDWTKVAGPLVASPVVWFIAFFFPLSLFKGFQHVSTVDELETGDTGGMRYDDVEKKKGVEMLKFSCPLLVPGEKASDFVEKTAKKRARHRAQSERASQGATPLASPRGDGEASYNANYSDVSCA